MILLNKIKSNYNGVDTSILCLACKPGFKADMFSEIPYAVQTCTQIQKCLSSTRFNSCESCDTGYVLKWDILKNSPILDECIEGPSNCLYATAYDHC